MSDPDDSPRKPQHGLPQFVGDPSEEKAARRLARERERATDADAVEHTVWSEPALSSDLAGSPSEGQVTYPRWLEENIRGTSLAKSYGITLLVALAAGPWGVLGAFSGAGNSQLSVLMFAVFGPVAEEIAKVAAALWVVEKRPFLFRSFSQILLCAACGGLAFAAIENLLYLHVYVPVHTPEFVNFRWTVCVALHVGCSLIAGVGLVQIWSVAVRDLSPPRLALGVPWFTAAMVIHGLYNLTVMFASAAGWLDLGMPEPTGE
ncbi:MAG: PrsW family intramembrane metalloprotease [Planctomycetes bacterium]|nr:PrsW family intramembrane metalloprotease [Planctomycetota bacterium]